MAIDYEKTALGERVAYYRKVRGFATPKALADAIPDGRVTRATIVNIEAGRKKDPSISDLMGISYGLGVSPLALLFDMNNLFDPTDLPDIFPGEWAKLPAISVLDVLTFEVHLFETATLLQDPKYKLDVVRGLRAAFHRIAALESDLAGVRQELEKAVDDARSKELTSREGSIERERDALRELIGVYQRTAPLSGVVLPEDIGVLLDTAQDSRVNTVTSRNGHSSAL